MERVDSTSEADWSRSPNTERVLRPSFGRKSGLGARLSRNRTGHA